VPSSCPIVSPKEATAICTLSESHVALSIFFGTGEEEAWRSWGNLTCGHLLEMAKTVQATIKQGKEGGSGLQYQKLTHGFWRRYVQRELLIAGGEEKQTQYQRERTAPALSAG